MKKVELPKTNLSNIPYPLKTLLVGNEDTWNSFIAVISDLTPKQLAYKYPNYSQRSISEMINHALDTQFCFYTISLVVGDEYKALDLVLPKTANEAFKNILEIYKKTVGVWKELKQTDFQKEIKTDWGQIMTVELTLFQSITHTHYHLSEICFLRGLGGFPTKVMG